MPFWKFLLDISYEGKMSIGGISSFKIIKCPLSYFTVKTAFQIRDAVTFQKGQAEQRWL